MAASTAAAIASFNTRVLFIPIAGRNTMTESLNAENAACKAQAASNSGDMRETVRERAPLPRSASISLQSALACLEAALDLVDDINPALAADQTVVAVTAAEGLQ